MKCSVKCNNLGKTPQPKSPDKQNQQTMILPFFIRRLDFNNFEKFCSEEAKPSHLDFIICLTYLTKLLCHAIPCCDIFYHINHKTPSMAALHQAEVHPAAPHLQ